MKKSKKDIHVECFIKVTIHGSKSKKNGTRNDSYYDLDLESKSPSLNNNSVILSAIDAGIKKGVKKVKDGVNLPDKDLIKMYWKA